MRVAIKEPEKDIRTIEINNSLRTLQELVGGYIETLPFSVLGVIMIMNEEGKLDGLPFNFMYYGDPIVGTVIFAGDDIDEFTDLTDEQVESLKSVFVED